MYYLRSKQRMITTTLSGISLNNVHLLKNKITLQQTSETLCIYSKSVKINLQKN